MAFKKPLIFCASMPPKLVKKTEVMSVAKNTSQRPYTEEGTVDLESV